MTGREAAAAVPLGLAVLATWLGAWNLARMRGAFDRLHVAGFLAVVPPVLVALAISIAEGPSNGIAVRAWLFVGLSVVAGPIVTHATARAIHLRRQSEAKAGPGAPGGDAR